MVLGALGRLTGEAIRGLARNLFAGFYERGISANEALRELRDAGLGYRRQDFLNDFRLGESAWSQETKVRYVGLDKIPSEGILEPLYHGVPDRYSMVFKVSGVNTETGESDTRYFFYHRNSLESRRNMEQEAEEWFSSKSEEYPFMVEAIQLTEGYINPLWA